MASADGIEADTDSVDGAPACFGRLSAKSAPSRCDKRASSAGEGDGDTALTAGSSMARCISNATPSLAASSSAFLKGSRDRCDVVRLSPPNTFFCPLLDLLFFSKRWLIARSRSLLTRNAQSESWAERSSHDRVMTKWHRIHYFNRGRERGKECEDIWNRPLLHDLSNIRFVLDGHHLMELVGVCQIELCVLV